MAESEVEFTIKWEEGVILNVDVKDTNGVKSIIFRTERPDLLLLTWPEVDKAITTAIRFHLEKVKKDLGG